MLLIGLTGGIGSGKTTVANYFAELGIPIIDSDEIARLVVLPGTEGLKQIAAHFGANILDENQQLNRAMLRQKIFSEPDEREWLENLLHPLIRAEIQRQAKQHAAAYAIIVIPLLIEAQFHDFINRVLVVDAPEQLQVTRASSRDQCSDVHIKKIMATQVSRSERLQYADDVITNDGDLSTLKAQVLKMHEFYLQIAQK